MTEYVNLIAFTKFGSLVSGIDDFDFSREFKYNYNYDGSHASRTNMIHILNHFVNDQNSFVYLRSSQIKVSFSV